MKINRLHIYIDIAFCLVLLPALIMLLPVDRWLEDNLLFVVMLLVLLYSTYAMCRFSTASLIYGDGRRRIVALSLFVVSLVATYMLTHYQLEHSMPPPLGRPMRGANAMNQLIERRVHTQQQAVWFLYVLVLSFGAAVSLLVELYRQRAERQSIEVERKRAELALYKAQINPHFLFNTLNTLYGLIVSKSQMAEDAFIQFSNLMKYMCTYSTSDSVPLQTEVDYIEQYISLQRYRLSDHTKVNFRYECDQQSRGCVIAPMLLITFVENALKYGVSSHTPSVVDILIKVNEGVLVLETHNANFADQYSSERSGIGIDNCRNRLSLLYAKRYTLLLDKQMRDYRAVLTIKL
ncbi:MAG: histidine kinase [Rikenellaceae bacterium]